MNPSLTKDYFDSLFMNHFCKKYRHEVFGQTFQRMFSENEAIEPGDEVVYRLIGIMDDEMRMYIRKFTTKYHCRHWMDRDQFHFAPIFSEIKRTRWTEIVDRNDQL